MPARILVVEDDAIIAQDIQHILVGLGYDVPTTAASGDEALSAVGTEHPNLVMMDIRLRGKMDGIEAAARIRDMHGTPVIYMTAHSDETTLTRAKGTGAYGYVLKPFTDRELRSTIEVALQKHALEMQLIERERWFATTLRSVGDAVLAVDLGGRVTFMNRAAEVLTRWSAEEAKGKPAGEVFRIHEGHPGAEGSIEGKSPSLYLERRTGEGVPVEQTTSSIVDDAGRVRGTVVVFRDVTERKNLEKRLIISDRLAAVGRLAGGMGHEINNPLTYIAANLDILRERVEQSASLSDADGTVTLAAASFREMMNLLGEARDGAMRIRDVVRGLSRFTSSHATQSETVDVVEALDQALALTAHQLRGRADVRRAIADVPQVVADEAQLVSTLASLLTNAAEALQSVGESPHWVRVAAFTDPLGRAVIEIEDDGIGIAPENMALIFEPFYTTKPIGSASGIGLGLAVARDVVRALGGTLVAESEPGRGALFRIVLPAAPSAPSRSPPDEAAAPQRIRVLVIDDDEMVGRSVVRILRREHDVVIANGGRAGLAQIDAGDTFDVILCDLMMPDMGGVAFFEALRAAHPDLLPRLIFISAGAADDATRAFLAAQNHLLKPFTADRLRAAVRECIRAHGSATPR